MKKIFQVAILSLTLGAGAKLAQADDLQTCQKALSHLSQVYSLDLLAQCQDFYWHNGDLDAPAGSFNNIIKLGYRYIALAPDAHEQYGNMAWLLWSKWCTYNRDHAQMPDGATKLEEAKQLLFSGRRANPNDADYFFESANMFFMMTNYSPELVAEAIADYKRTDELTIQITQPKIRSRLNIAHLLRKGGDIPNAIVWYKRVLEIDPTNKVAQKCLEQIEPKPLY